MKTIKTNTGYIEITEFYNEIDIRIYDFNDKFISGKKINKETLKFY